MRLRILSGGAAQGLVGALAPQFEAETGCEIGGTFGAVGAMRDKLLAGEPADLLILSRALIDGGFLDPERFVEYGVGRFINSREHIAWALERGVTIIGVEKALEFKSAAATALTRISRGVTEPAFVSIDMDAIDGSQAPGVSAVNPMGLDVAGVARLAEQAGRDPRIVYLDIMELAPPLDAILPPQIGATSRVAATLLMHFLTGFAERGG